MNHMLMKITTVIAASMLLPLFNLTPANAILGLSKCEKVKKEVNSIEKKYFNNFKKVLGEYYKNPSMFSSGSEIFILLDESIPVIDRIKSENHIFKIWKIGTNNPKCFTNTQELRIKEMKTESASNYITYTRQTKYNNAQDCKNLFQSLTINKEKEKQCNLGLVNVLIYNQEYKSIYTY